MIDANSHYYSDLIGIEAGAYYVISLVPKNNGVHGYLADHDSFGLVTRGGGKVKTSG